MSTAEISSLTRSLTKDISEQISSPQKKLGGIKASIDPQMLGMPGSLDTLSLACGDHVETRNNLISEYFEKKLTPHLTPEQQEEIRKGVTQALPMNDFGELQGLFGSRKKAAAAKLGTCLKAHPILKNTAAVALAGSGALSVLLAMYGLSRKSPSTVVIVQ
jgi:hypothetical protein